MNTKDLLIYNERIDLYYDFVINLIYYIDAYYLDKETLSDDNDIKNFYDFCYGKVCNEFIRENIDFIDNKKLYDYYFTFFNGGFFKNDDYEKFPINEYLEFWEDIFNSRKTKDESNIQIFLEIYKIFDESLNKRKFILEYA